MKKKYTKPTIESIKLDPPKVLFDGSPDDESSGNGNGHGHGKACEHHWHSFCD